MRAYLEHYSRPGDVVLDPFGGSGVIPIEAFLLGRRAIHNDLNPFANFIARNIADTTLPSVAPLRAAFERVRTACVGPLSEIERSEAAARRWLERLPLPTNIRLPQNSDAEFFYELFTPRQLAGLALIKQAIETAATGVVRDLLLLAWSASVAKLNKTFLSARGRAPSRGGSSIFSLYRYKVAARWVELPIWETFRGRFANVLAAKEEVLRLRKYRRRRSGGGLPLDSRRDFQVLACAAAAPAPSPAGPPPPAEPAQVLAEVFDTCLANGRETFTSEALFNRLVLELWRRRALGCLNLDRRAFAEQLRRRGWDYNPRTHQWLRSPTHQPRSGEPLLFPESG